VIFEQYESKASGIQGEMGADVSSWRLAQAVSKLGQRGVVSGTALDHILDRRLQGGQDEKTVGRIC
jgi:nitronate monooxygenase